MIRILVMIGIVVVVYNVWILGRTVHELGESIRSDLLIHVQKACEDPSVRDAMKKAHTPCPLDTNAMPSTPTPSKGVPHTTW